MLGKILLQKNNSLKTSLFLPASLFLSSIFIIFAAILASTNLTTFAAPSPPSTPITLSTYTYSPTVDFHFTSSELTSSTFKQEQLGVGIESNNPTGVTSYFSSIDEDTNLNHTDPAITQKINSIATNLLDSAFSPKTWGYRVSGYNPLGNIFSPIPKASAPDTVFVLNNSDHTKYFVKFGVKAAPDLVPGTYSKQVLFTTVTNHVPTTATFLPGPMFNKMLTSVNSSLDMKSFRHAPFAPANLSSATVVSTADSESPIYLWYDSTDKNIYWWSEADTVYTNEDCSEMFASINTGSSNHVELIDVTGINTSKTKNMSRMFKSGPLLIKNINLNDLDTSNVEDMSYMFSTSGASNPVDVDLIDFSRFNTSKVKDMRGMFKGSYLSSVDLSRFDTSNVKDMSLMFQEAKNLTHVNLTGFNTRNVQNMSQMFAGANKLVSLDLSGWQNNELTDTSIMFYNASSLTSLNLTGFKTSNVLTMANMFSGASTLTTLDLSSFDTSKVTSMNYMFHGMTALTNLNISSFNTGNVVDMSGMFAGLQLSSLNLAHFDTKNVINMSSMFQGMEKLTNLNISNFDTRKVNNMSNMFFDSMTIPENGILDISSFNTQSLSNATGMFFHSKVKTIYASPNFTTNLMSASQELFYNNPNLQGGNGTHFINGNGKCIYARIDASGTPGYFTQKP